MNTLKLYYSYIKTPYSTPFVFILNVSDCSHYQETKNISLLKYVFSHYLVIEKYFLFERKPFIEVNSRGPPLIWSEV